MSKIHGISGGGGGCMKHSYFYLSDPELTWILDIYSVVTL